MSSIGLKFDGKVIEELSSKIPSNIFALNELTKNAYDAFATEVEIKIDAVNSKLYIKDNGLGMSQKDIQKLLHIANSSKKYGSKRAYNNMERYVQGSKGLGFLSVFKFGNKVTWRTFSNGAGIEFSMVKSDLISKSNASRFKITPEYINSEGVGTEIIIDMDEDELDVLSDYFEDEKHSTKTVNAFYDNTINIILDSVHGRYETIDPLFFIKEAEEYQFCYASYNSSSSKIKFYKKGDLIDSVDFRVSAGGYKLEVDLMIYHFKQGKTKTKAGLSKLFYREPDDALTPLLFVNDNLFNNYMIFDSNINRAKRSGQSMPQMTGYVRVYSSSQELDFNSDRTNFVENNLTRKIISDLNLLNRRIQNIVAGFKNKEKELNGEISTGKAYEGKKDDTGKDVSEKVELEVAKINLKTGVSRRHTIPSPQLNLKDYISSAIDSSNKDIDLDALSFLVNGKSSNFILASVSEECVKEIEVFYEDLKTGVVIESFKLEFYAPRAVVSGVSKRELFTLATNKAYNVKMPFVSDLLNQTSELYKSSKTGYFEVIACSLRAILELSVDHLKSKFPHIFSHQKPSCNSDYNDRLLWDVVQVVYFMKSNKPLLTKISDVLTISFNSLNNFLEVESYKMAVKNAHLGAHKAVAFLTPDDVKSLAQRAGHFAVFCDVMIYKIEGEVITGLTVSSFANNG